MTAAGFALRVEDAARFVEQTRVLPFIHTSTAIPLDVVLGGPGLEELFAQRAGMIDIGGVTVPVASAEDLIVMKVLAGRPKDLDDVVALAAIRADLDLTQVHESLALIEDALGQSDLLPALRHCLARAGRQTE